MIQSRNQKLLLLVPATPEPDKRHRQQTRKTNRCPFVLPTLTARPTAKEPGHPAGSHQVLALADPAINLALVEKRAVAQILPSAGCGRSSEHARVDDSRWDGSKKQASKWTPLHVHIIVGSYDIISHHLTSYHNIISIHIKA